MVELAERPTIAPEILPPLQNYGIIFSEQHPYEEVLKSEMNPKWVLLNLIVGKDDLDRINEEHKHRPYATFFLSPEGYEELNRFILHPHFTALLNAYNGVTPPNLEECKSWPTDIKTSIEVWYLNNRLEYFKRVLRKGRLTVSEETLNDTSSKLHDLQSRATSLPTSGLINNLVGDIVVGIKSGKV